MAHSNKTPVNSDNAYLFAIKTMQTSPKQDETAPSLIRFPSRFPIKIIGVSGDGLVDAVTATARRFDPAFDPRTVELRPSKSGSYLGLTIYVTATSKAQLDALYQVLSTHPAVRVVL